MKKNIYFLFFIFIFIGCNTTKRLTENEILLTKNNILIDGKKNKDEKISELITLNPNGSALGIPLALYFYNLGNKDNPQTVEEWAKEKPKKYERIKKLFSEKQSIAYAKSMIGINNWFLRNGEAPRIIDQKKIDASIENLNIYLKTKGFFKNKVTASVKETKKKKAEITYNITTGRPLLLDSIKIKIKSPVLDSIYRSAKSKSFLKSGDQYDEANFINEAKRITKLYRNNGLYFFSDNYLGFYEIDSVSPNFKTNVDLIVSGERIIEQNGNYISKPLKVQKLRNINVYTDYSFTNKDSIHNDTLVYNNIKFWAHDKLKYNAKYLSEAIFLEKGTYYSDSLRNLTRKHLKSLKNFKSTTIKYSTVDNNENELDVDVLLTPIEKYTLGLETELTHSNIRDLGLSGKFSVINRNTFRGAEIFKLSLLGSFFNASQAANETGNFFNSYEFGADISLEVPRLIAPFGLNRSVPKTMSPRTFFSLGTSFQKNIGLDRQTITGMIDYKWEYNNKKTIQLEVFNTQYVRNLNVGSYFNIFNSEFQKLEEIAPIFDSNFQLSQNDDSPLELMDLILNDINFQASNPEEYSENLNILDRYNIITSDFLIPTIAYSFTYNNQTNFQDNNFSFFKVRLANSGNLLGLVNKARNENNRRTSFGIPLAQYFKTDIEYKKFWNTNSNSVFGIRTFLGAIFAYDNSDIPFIKSYFAGGSNDIRAWQTYDLGPGRRANGLEFNIGSLKFLTSAEYRFNMFGSLNGALFVDAGNIWSINNTSILNNEERFRGFDSVQDIAIGSGFGFRYDFSFLILRLDLAFKMHEPYLSNNRWFQNYNFSNAVYNIGINYPF